MKHVTLLVALVERMVPAACLPRRGSSAPCSSVRGHAELLVGERNRGQAGFTRQLQSGSSLTSTATAIVPALGRSLHASRRHQSAVGVLDNCCSHLRWYQGVAPVGPAHPLRRGPGSSPRLQPSSPSRHRHKVRDSQVVCSHSRGLDATPAPAASVTPTAAASFTNRLSGHGCVHRTVRAVRSRHCVVSTRSALTLAARQRLRARHWLYA